MRIDAVRRIACLVSVLVVAASATGAGESAHTNDGVAAYSPPGHLLFTRAGGNYGDETVFYSRADGHQQKRLTPFGVSCCARARRDGSRALFSWPVATGGSTRITTATAKTDGSDLRKIRLPDKTISLGPGAWSPNGRQIAFQVWDERHRARA